MVELLSPAGSFDSFLGAINAGADAIYLGGEKYSARAYAGNFTDGQIVEALNIAHFYGKKVYLALNTLLKDDEIEQAATFLEPFYERQLDGVIVQDFGLSFLLGQMYPALELHASTQMTVTGPAGAEFLKEKGFTRVVPARELSLEEIKNIRQKVDLETECFIHGAMCYCYSGQCLFSSILGGRSGNRGRCAQPCRLPYTVHIQDLQKRSQETYPLSMKDLCTVYMLPDLIEAGIDSFKIEGRMKQPAYVCGVTALYRKYIDLYHEYGREAYSVQREDGDRLSNLYIRSDIHDGYYRKHNGRDMITSGQPSYVGSDEALIRELSEKYIKLPPKQPVDMQIFLEPGKAVRLCVSDDAGVGVEAFGDIPQHAKGSPVTKEQIQKQLQKTGNSLVTCGRVTVHMQDALFLPVSALNRLRRDAVALYEDKKGQLHECGTEGITNDRSRRPADDVTERYKSIFLQKEDGAVPYGSHGEQQIHVSVMSLEQIEALEGIQPGRLYVEADLWLGDRDAAVSHIREFAGNVDIYLTLPYIVRKRDRDYYDRIFTLLQKDKLVKGFLLRNLEQAQMAKDWRQKLPGKSIRCIGDTNLYQMNHFSADFTAGILDEYTLPYELNHRETKRLCAESGKRGRVMTQVIYGRIPMMVSANCIKKTENGCDHIQALSDAQYLEDRYKKKFPVYNNCIHCYNVIYNSVPYSLHNKIDQIRHIGSAAFRMDFVMEEKSEVQRILGSFIEALSKGKAVGYVPKEFTTGHFARGVE